QKAVRSLEKDRYGLGFVKNFHDLSKSELLKLLEYPTSERYFVIYEALRKGATVDEINALTHVKSYFLEEMKALVEEEEHILTFKGFTLPDDVLITAKKDGFSDRYLAMLLGVSEHSIRQHRESLGVIEHWEGVHVSGTENGAYYYSSYNPMTGSNAVSSKRKVMILGGGPNRIGQGIEFDYCCVHAAQSLKKLGFETIIVNCNPETVSTDYDTSDKLYFEPLTLEDVLSIYREEKPVGVIAQFGGQTPLNLASELERNGVKILGTSPEIIDLAEDRGRFKSVMDSLGIPMPESGMAATLEEARAVVASIGYPVMVRPSYVLGGRGMEIVYDEESLESYVKAAVGVTPDRPILIDRFLNHALECEADAICDGTHAYVPAVMEHIELAGIHSGDSACILPSRHITPEALATIKDYTRKIAEAMHVVGLMNIQYAIEAGKVFVLEANPRASRTVPLVSKVCGIRMVPLAVEAITRELTGRSSPLETLGERVIPYYGVKEAVFPFNMFQEVDPVLGPEMRSTGEVLGLAVEAGEAFFKAEEAANAKLPLSGTVLIAVSDSDKKNIAPIAKKYIEAGFGILATEGTYDALRNAGIECSKVGSKRPDVLDHVINGQVQLIINTPREKAFTMTGSALRRGAVKAGIPYITTLDGARAAVEGILTVKNKGSNTESLRSIKEWHSMIH
ncbi:MAG: carbamoyl-phosphate synthase large subunit, partial [Synergistaceae bacterium]|nr:carbamoyl-phosphate synthase large subunit [Synergistaceae bacterium]